MVQLIIYGAISVFEISMIDGALEQGRQAILSLLRFDVVQIRVNVKCFHRIIRVDMKEGIARMFFHHYFG